MLLIISLFTGNSIAMVSPDMSVGTPLLIIQITEKDSVKSDTLGPLKFPFKDTRLFAKSGSQDTSALYLKKPSNIKTLIEYDPISGDYLISEKIGNIDYRLPSSFSREEYLRNDLRESIDRYWRDRMAQNTLDQKSQLVPQFRISGQAFNKVFGSNIVNIKPQGYVEMSLGVKSNRIENPSIPVRMQRNTTFDFSQKINVNLDGQIGDRLKMRFNYNTDATFDFENKIKLDYQSNEDDIVKNIEAGNVSMPLTGTLIRGGTNLFGVKTDLQFGKLSVSTVFSQQKGETKVINTEGGAEKSKFEINATDYDANRHFLLGHFFYESYDNALKELPIIKSAVTINKIEVWVTNKSNRFQESRNILALMDLGEKGINKQNQSIPAFGDTPGLPFPFNTYPGNDINGLYKQITTTYSGVRDIAQVTQALGPLSARDFVGGRDYEKIENARLLDSTEYSLNRQLGYLSLNQSLNNDEVLAIAYQYTVNGEKFQVGEFSTDGIAAPGTLILKLLKGTNLNPVFKNWRLMMKNIYNINSQRVSGEDFKMDVLFKNDAAGSNINYLPDGPLKEKILLGVMNLDHLNKQLDPYPDGIFDFLEHVTINSQRGRIIFPVIEPFGTNLERQLNGDVNAIKKYVFRSLYDNTKTAAVQDAEKNKYRLMGSYKGSSNTEISLDAINITRGSVKVMAGGRQLQEDVDFIVDYTQGKVKVINQGLLESGTPISISTESQDLFSMQRKTMLGTHLNYEFNKNFNLGTTLMYLQEKPLYQKVNYGEDPISNLMLGLNASYNTTSGMITRAVNALPFLKTNAESKVAVEAEWARLFPGHSKVISKEGAAYLDDFEGAKTPINLKSFVGWSMASIPQANELFPEGNLINDLSSGFNRALLSWYIIDPYMQRRTAPSYLLEQNKLDDHRVREVFQYEIFPDRETPAGQPTNIPTLDLSYFPADRGSNNYDAAPSAFSSGVNRNGTLKSPETRWGGIMRKIETSDFEAANVEYIEFWLMDPFAMDSVGSPNPGGDLYFNLGNVSEDILRDGRKSFEHGLPGDGNYTNTDQTNWGRVSRQQSLVKAFDNSPQARINQDIGLDGLSSADEKSFFSKYLTNLTTLVADTALTKATKDPSSDDYHYFRGTDYDSEKKDVLERYKYFARTEGNSPTSGQSPESYPTAATSIPDVEDINDDNTLNENEAYYQYHIKFDRNNMVLGKNYISDIKKAEPTLKSGKKSPITWYQFKIPISSPDKVYGAINDFRSIRFIRMFLKGWQKPVVMRFATLDLVRTNWRRYDKDLTEDKSLPATGTQFEIAAVNVEENSNRKPVNYIVPPGVSRVIDPSNAQLTQLNEQAMVLRTIDLEPGDARGAYKTMMIDMRRYKTLKMEVHAEEMSGAGLRDDDLYLFVRLGSDFQYNYYEYEIPLKLTIPGYYDSNTESDRFAVWPEANRIYIPLDQLPQLKLDRNTEMRKAGSLLTISDIFEKIHSGVNNNKNRIKVKGNPDLSQVEVAMIGIRNKKGRTLGPKSVETWVNELRLTQFEEKGGWAAIGRVSGNLADLGTYSFAGRVTTTGFGSIDSKMGQRTLDDSHEYDISTNLELGKFFKEESGVKIPLYVGFSKSLATPEYSPLDKDVKLTDALANAGSSQARDSIKRISQTFTSRKSINLTNVQITNPNKTGDPKIYDLSNFSLTYAHNQYDHGDINTILEQTLNTRTLLNYNFVSRPVSLDPFKNFKFLKSPAMALVRDFNLNFIPGQISFRSDLNRTSSVLQYRNITNPGFLLPKSYLKDFTWNRYYDFRFDLTRGLKIDFSAINSSRIDEPLGALEKNLPGYQARRDTIWNNILNGGRNTHYHHTWNIAYTIPVNKLPLLDWISSSAIYQAGYDWDVAPLTRGNYVLGNSINNSSAIQLNGQADFLRLYNRVPYLKRINQKYGEFSRGRRDAQQKRGQNLPLNTTTPTKFRNGNTVLIKNVPQSIFHKLGTANVIVNATDEKGKVIKGKTKVINENRVMFTPEINCAKAIVEVTGTKDQSAKSALKLDEYLARFLMMLYNVNISYTENGGTALYGYLPGTNFFGSSDYESAGGNTLLAPGLPFILGQQDPNFGQKAAQKGWVSTDSILNKPFMMSKNTRLNFRAKLVPIPDLKIDINASRSYSNNSSEFLIYNDQNGWGGYNKSFNGNFSMTVISIGSSFENLGKSEVQDSKVWNQFKQNREIIARRLDQSRIANASIGYVPGTFDPKTGFPAGYGPSAQQVLIPAFLAAYSGKSAETIPLTPFPSAKFMMPNWRIQYSGVVNKIAGLKDVMKSMSITHDYRSTYSVGSYISNLNYTAGSDGYSYIYDAQNNFLSKYDIATININETFNPLFDIDITWLNNVTSRFEYRKSRNVMLSLTNNQAMELFNNEASMGLGYRFENMKLFVKTKSSQKALNNDLNVRADLTYGKNKTVLRKLIEENNQTTAGQESFSIKFSADYNLSEVFIVRLFYDRILNSPFISNSYRTTNSNFGVSFRFTLMQ
ncbi:MAG: cell surface protein SprA [Mariniphaga sp.]